MLVCHCVSFSKTKKCHLTNEVLERKVFGFDINKKRIKELKIGFDKTNEITDKNLITSAKSFVHD